MRFFFCPLVVILAYDEANNAVRHNYRVLSDEGKAQIGAIKDMGAELLEIVNEIRNQQVHPAFDAEGKEIAILAFDPELNIAAERVEAASGPSSTSQLKRRSSYGSITGKRRVSSHMLSVIVLK